MERLKVLLSINTSTFKCTVISYSTLPGELTPCSSWPLHLARREPILVFLAYMPCLGTGSISGSARQSSEDQTSARPVGQTSLAELHVSARRRGGRFVHSHMCAREGGRREHWSIPTVLWTLQGRGCFPPIWHNSKDFSCVPQAKVIVNFIVDAAGKRKAECSGPVPLFSLCGGCQLVQLCLGVFSF